MIPTFVFGWPSGQETGEYLALDLGASAPRRRLRSAISLTQQVEPTSAYVS